MSNDDKFNLNIIKQYYLFMFHLHAGKNCVIHLNNINQLIEQKCYFGLDIPINSCCSSCAVKYVVENLNQLIDAANTNNIHSMIVLGYYYMLETDYNNAIKYYKMVLSNDHSKLLNDDYNMLLNNLGDIYCRELNEDEMKKYYLMAIDNHDAKTMRNLGHYYYQEEQYDEMEKYYLLAIDHKDVTSMKLLGDYYYENEQYDKFPKYYQMAFDNGDKKIMLDFGNRYFELENYDKMFECYSIAIKLRPNDAFIITYQLKNKKKLLHKFVELCKDNDEALNECKRILSKTKVESILFKPINPNEHNDHNDTELTITI